MRYYEMKRHAVAAYLTCVVGCDKVLYEVNAFGGRDFDVDLIGCCGDKLVVFVDLSEKFSHYPKEMKHATMRRKLIQRYMTLRQKESGVSSKQVFEIWHFGVPPEKLELVLPSVCETLQREHGLTLNIVDGDNVKERLKQTVEQILRGSNCDYTNPFTQAVLIAHGMLELPRYGIAQMPDKLPLRLPSAYLIPEFVWTMLESEYVVGWLGFDVGAFDLLITIAHELRKGIWDRFLKCFSEPAAFAESSEVFFAEDEWSHIEWTELPMLELRRYSHEELTAALKFIFSHAGEFLEVWQSRISNTMVIRIEYMLPFVFKHPQFSAELIEAEVAKYGGDRELVRMHMQTSNPDKRPYRGSIVIELANALEHMRFSEPNRVLVPIDDPKVSDDVVAGMWLTYQPEFAGYFQLTFDSLLPRWQELRKSS
ncbi:MAG: hypothetical protein RMK18_11140 [Armatimonadota bacterium]|nr:hypothetical protein [Armatimonadota bacterium]MCX7778346.1 hypothetical protein [Armatimonadota bacterium]MDW8026402.1 hypothetical protein [Armatimonadota bacterium]